jgi:hypothetical protein
MPTSAAELSSVIISAVFYRVRCILDICVGLQHKSIENACLVTSSIARPS